MTEITQDKSVQISPETLPVITWEGARVITTDLLARLYVAEEHQIRQNYVNNADRFELGKHFYKLEGKSLREFKRIVHRVDKSYSVTSPNARSLTLWTERGAARHAKILETDAAWEVFERLEDCYFSTREKKKFPYRVTPNQTLSAEQADELRSLITTHAETLPKGSQAAFVIQAWSKLKAHFGVGYRQIPASRFTEALSILARHIAGQSTPSLLNRRWLVSIDHLGCEQVTPIPGDAGILRLADLPETLRDPGALIDAELLAEIGAACFERLRSKVGALKEARFIASQRRQCMSG